MIAITGYCGSGLDLVGHIVKQLGYEEDARAFAINKSILKNPNHETKLFGNHKALYCIDPAFCLTTEAWYGIPVKYIVCVRHPAICAKKQLADDIDADLIYHVEQWVKHYDGLTGVSAEDCLYVDFDLLLEDPLVQIARIASFLRIYPPTDILQKIANTIDPVFKHYTSTVIHNISFELNQKIESMIKDMQLQTYRSIF